jgi:uncharacterized protein
MAALNQPLTDAEYERVASMLARSDRAMNVEMLDGFFAALICGPDLVRPSEYLRVIWGGDKIGGDKGWRDEAEMQEFFDLVMRHWNSTIGALSSGEPFMPFLLEDDDGIARANDWAEGFARGMKLRTDGWTELFDDEKHAGLLVPILALAHERDPDPAMRPYKEPIDAERREQLIIGAAAGVTGIYRYFAARRHGAVLSRQEVATPQHSKGKVGRNEPCPCGSGKKFKKCCGAVTLH